VVAVVVPVPDVRVHARSVVAPAATVQVNTRRGEPGQNTNGASVRTV
jgi:hypothetical protein